MKMGLPRTLTTIVVAVARELEPDAADRPALTALIQGYLTEPPLTVEEFSGYDAVLAQPSQERRTTS